MSKSKASVAKVEVATPRRPGALNTLARVREELANVYRDGRVGNIKTSDMTKFAYTLRELSRVLEGESFEARIAALEERRG